HQNSRPATGPFIKVNSTAIPETLFESELFGFERGAFTGANASKPGKFELADKGSLFLDEIGDVPAAMQVKLLLGLQEREFERRVALSADPIIDADDIHLDSGSSKQAAAATPALLPEGMTLEQWEDEMIREALRRAQGNKSQAARLLGLSRNALRYRLSKMGLPDEGEADK